MRTSLGKERVGDETKNGASFKRKYGRKQLGKERRLCRRVDILGYQEIESGIGLDSQARATLPMAPKR